jgi:hypothetical protein
VVNRCCFCKLNGESVDHLILHCEVASVVVGCLGLCLSVWRICLLVGGRGIALGVLSCGRWFLFVLCESLWRERKDKSFGNQGRTSEELKSFFFFSLLTAACLAPLVITFSDFLVLFSHSTWLLYTSCILGLRSSMLFDIYNITYIKKKVLAIKVLACHPLFRSKTN